MSQLPLHKDGSRQPVIFLNLSIPLDLIPNYDFLDDFLLTGFGFDNPGFDQSDFRGKGNSIHIPRLLERITFLAQAMLQAINIAVFEKSRILELSRDLTRNLHLLKISTATVEFVPEKLIAQAFKLSLKMIAGFCNINEKPDYEKLFQEIDQNFVLKYKMIVPGGASTITILESAFALNIPFTHLGGGVYQLGWGAQSIRFDRSVTDKDSSVARKISLDKVRTSRLLGQFGIPVPKQVLVSSLAVAIDAAEKIGYPVVIKPSDRERSEGVTINVFDAHALSEAYQAATKSSKNIVVEQQVSGVCHRMLVINGRVRAIAARHPLHVCGDGMQSIRELSVSTNISVRQRAIHLRQKQLDLNKVALAKLRDYGLSPDSVPEKGRKVYFSDIDGAVLGGMSENVFDYAHPENVEIAERAARACGLEIAGVDMITPDISVPWYENSAVINEVNFAPMMTRRFQWNRSAAMSALQELFPGRGRIPVIACVGGVTAIERAHDLQSQYSLEGKFFHVCELNKVFLPCGERLRLSGKKSIASLVRALFLDKATEGIIIVVPTRRILNDYLPVDRVSWLIDLSSEGRDSLPVDHGCSEGDG